MKKIKTILTIIAIVSMIIGLLLMYAEIDMMICLPFVLLAMILSKIVLAKKS